VYLLSVNPKGFKSLVISKPASYAKHNCLHWSGNSKQNNWVVPRLSWFKKGFMAEYDSVADFTFFAGGAIAVSNRAKEVLSELFGGQAEFLPSIGPDQNNSWSILNVVNVVDIMDASKSIYEVYEDGALAMCRYAYLSEVEAHNMIYLVKGYEPYVFVSESVKELIEDAGLSGAIIKEYINPGMY